jgi:hypothetical protein
MSRDRPTNESGACPERHITSVSLALAFCKWLQHLLMDSATNFLGKNHLFSPSTTVASFVAEQCLVCLVMQRLASGQDLLTL